MKHEILYVLTTSFNSVAIILNMLTIRNIRKMNNETRMMLNAPYNMLRTITVTDDTGHILRKKRNNET